MSQHSGTKAHGRPRPSAVFITILVLAAPATLPGCGAATAPACQEAIDRAAQVVGESILTAAITCAANPPETESDAQP